MAVKNIVKAVPLTSFDSADNDGTYHAINPDGLPNACFMIRISNGSSEPVLISFDGVNDHDWLGPNTNGDQVLTLMSQTNAQPNNHIANFPVGTIVYVKEALAGTGLIYLAGYYQPSGG